MKNLIEFILIHLVQFPDDVAITETEEEGRFIYTISVNPEDIGKVIGKNGSVIQSIRNICKIRAIKEGIHATVIVDDGRDE